jgi:hypothetical protein
MRGAMVDALRLAVAIDVGAQHVDVTPDAARADRPRTHETPDGSLG